MNPTPVSFTEFTDGTAENPVPGPKSVKITMKREQAQEYYENQNNTDQKKETAAVLCGKVGESPKITKANGRACRGKNKTEISGKISAFAHL